MQRGELVRPAVCEQCGAAGDIHGHHDDYAKPLEVRWLCHPCHAGEHTVVGWTPQAQALRDQGASYAEIARVLGFSEHTVWKRLNPSRARLSAQRDNAKRRAVKQAQENERIRSLDYRGRCYACGGPMGVGIAHDGTCRSCRPARIAELIDLWNAGLTTAEIGERLGRSKYGVRVEISKLRAKGYDIPHRRTPEQVKRIAEGSARGLGRPPYVVGTRPQDR